MTKYDTIIKRLDGSEVHGASINVLPTPGDGHIVQVGEKDVPCKVTQHLTTPVSKVDTGFDGAVEFEELEVP